MSSKAIKHSNETIIENDADEVKPGILDAVQSVCEWKELIA